MSMSLEHFIRFETDIVGVERTLRLVQALLLLATSYPWLLELAVFSVRVLAGPGSASAAAAEDPEKHLLVVAHYGHVVLGLRNLVNLVRRFFRVFRFVESFHRANQQFSALVRDRSVKQPASARLPLVLDAFAASFFGMHLLLEVLVLPDVVGVDGLAAWGPERVARLNLENQRFWFLALACSLCAGLLRLARIARDVPLPEVSLEHTKSPLSEKDGAVLDDEDEDAKHRVLEEELRRLRRIASAYKEQRRVWRSRMRARAAVLVRHALADGIDLVLPGSAIGWTPVQPGTVGLAMLTTTLLTGYDAWQRCGQGL